MIAAVTMAVPLALAILLSGVTLLKAGSQRRPSPARGVGSETVARRYGKPSTGRLGSGPSATGQKLGKVVS